MVTVKVTPGFKPTFGYLIQAEGWGKSMCKRVDNKEQAKKWRVLAPSRLLQQRLIGIVAQRRIAYQAKHFVDPIKHKCLNDLHYYLDQVSGAGAEKLYKMVVAHQTKWMAIMPYGDNKMKTEMEGIILYCQQQLNNITNEVV